ncbi:MAG: ABC transporter permease [Treponema sp.]|jgi:spermidine/putrescine transport system permease protein|nr:ABC transporter permease [Treponema sp.]
MKGEISRRRNYGPLYSAPMMIWFTAFFLAPIIIIVVYSFLKKGLYGGVEPVFSLESYRSLGNSNYVIVAFRTIFISLVTTVITILVALPCGYYMARSRRQTLLLLLVIIPFWTNFLIRVFAWMNILGSNGFVIEFLNRTNLMGAYLRAAGALVHVGEIIEGGIKYLIRNEAVIEFLADIGVFHRSQGDLTMFLYNQNAVILVLIYMYLPYAILPLFATIDKFDFSLLEAARDLGATKLESVIKVLLPNVRGGIYTAVLFTFIPIFGAYTVPLIVGGMNSYMLGNVIADQLLKSRNWSLASAFSMVLTVVTTAGVIVMMNLQRRDARLAEVSRKNGGVL